MTAYLARVVSLYEAAIARRALHRQLRPVATRVWPSPLPPRVPLTLTVRRDGVPSVDYLATLAPELTPNAHQAIFTSQNGRETQWFSREAIYRAVIAQAYEYSEPRLGMTRWPTLGETAHTLLFNIVESGGGGEASTVDARVDVSASVDALPAARQVAIVERMSDGQWRVAGFGDSLPGQRRTLDLKVTPSGVCYALALDDYGLGFVPGLVVSVGRRIRPTQFAGWLYEITEAGTLPASEPQWWAAEGENPSRALGSARARAVRYYRPLAHGPFPVEYL